MYKSIVVRVNLENDALSKEYGCIQAESMNISRNLQKFIEDAANGTCSVGCCLKIGDYNGNYSCWMEVVETEEEPTCSC